LRFLCRNEIFHHSLPHQVRRQQTLTQNEVMEFLLVEFSSQRRLGFFS
jgi:hypothetical protein